MEPDLPSAAAAAACVYLLGGNPLGQKLVSLRQRGQNFIFPVHERSPAVQSSAGGIRSDSREPSADSGGRGAESLGPPGGDAPPQIPGSKASWPPGSFHRSRLQGEPERRGLTPRLDGCCCCWLAAVAAGCTASLQSCTESLRDSPACYSQRGGRAKAGWKHFCKLLTQTCSRSVFDMSDIYVHDLRKTRTVNHTYGDNLRLIAGRNNPDTTATTAQRGFQ